MTNNKQSISMRQHPRFATSVRVITLHGSEPETFTTRNISLGGLFVPTKKRWPVGSIVTLSIESDGKRLQTEARVTHIQGEGIGFAFVDPSEDFLNWLQGLFNTLVPERMGASGEMLESTAPRTIVWSDGNVEHQDRFRNLSTKNVVIIGESPAVGQEITIYLAAFTYSGNSTLPSEARSCMARVVHLKDDGFIAEFLNPSAEFSMALRDLIAHQSQ